MQNPSPKKVLFISHEASRSGAPIVLLHLLKWLKNNTTLQFEILLLNVGPLKEDFEQLGKTFLLGDLISQHSYPARIKKKLLGTTLNDQYRKAAVYLSKGKYNLVYGNTIVSLPWLKIFKEDHSLKTLCCIHELSYVLSYFFTREYLIENLGATDSVIAVSKAVKDTLLNKFNIPAKKVHLHYEFIDAGSQAEVGAISKDDLNITAGEFIIGMGGTPEWRKGTDLVIPLAIKLTEQYPDFKFKIVWLGGGKENAFVKQLMYDAHKSGIGNKLLFLDSQPNPLDFIDLFDVFVLLSREDPFPLIVLEAAYLNKPIIAFENSGGIPELIAQGAGFIAPYLNIDVLSDLIYKLSSDREFAALIGKKARELALDNYTSDIVSPGIYGEITKVMEGNL
ncbi:MAG: glycosyltransferase family 4 protein [Bacteroidota bacterium]|nr:glycosyltransferase family 4 protein [Bacteroidota bacterium]